MSSIMPRPLEPPFKLCIVTLQFASRQGPSRLSLPASYEEAANSHSAVLSRPSAAPHLARSILSQPRRTYFTNPRRPEVPLVRIKLCSERLLHKTPRRAFHQTHTASAKAGRGGTGASTRDPYEVLGVAKGANQSEIKKAYHKYHPDQNKNDKSANDKLTEINGAYEILGNEEKRKQFDQFGHAAFNPNMGGSPEGFEGGFPGGFPFGNMGSGGGVRMEDILRGFGFGGGGGGGMGMEMDEDEDDIGPRRQQARGKDIEVPLTIDFMDAIGGTEKVVEFVGQVQCKPCKGSGAKEGSKPTTCKACKGSGQEKMNKGMFVLAMTCRTCAGQGQVISDPCRTCNGNKVKTEKRQVSVKIPAGVDNGSTLRVPNQGDQAPNGKSGNLFVRLTVHSSELFRRDGVDVHLDVPISVSQSILGAKSIRVPTLRDGEMDVELPPGTQPDTTKVLRGQGINRIGSTQRGNAYVHFKVVIPTSLSAKQQKLMEEFALEEGEHPLKRSFFKKVKDFLHLRK